MPTQSAKPASTPLETREALANRLKAFETSSAEMWALLNDPLAVAEHLAELLRSRSSGSGGTPS